MECSTLTDLNRSDMLRQLAFFSKKGIILGSSKNLTKGLQTNWQVWKGHYRRGSGRHSFSPEPSTASSKWCTLGTVTQAQECSWVGRKGAWGRLMGENKNSNVQQNLWVVMCVQYIQQIQKFKKRCFLSFAGVRKINKKQKGKVRESKVHLYQFEVLKTLKHFRGEISNFLHHNYIISFSLSV